jgi:hypothetical protein
VKSLGRGLVWRSRIYCAKDLLKRSRAIPVSIAAGGTITKSINGVDHDIRLLEQTSHIAKSVMGHIVGAVADQNDHAF